MIKKLKTELIGRKNSSNEQVLWWFELQNMTYDSIVQMNNSLNEQ